MRDHKIIALLRSFSPSEKKALKAFLQSPYHNVREDVATLLTYLLSILNKPDPTAFQKERIWQAVFGDEVFNDLKLRHTLSYLLTVIKKYLAVSFLEKNPAQQQLNVCLALKDKQAAPLLERALKKFEKQTKEIKARGAEWHYHNFQIHQIRHELDIKQRRVSSSLPTQAAQELTDFFAIQYLRTACAMQTYKQVSNRSIDLDLLPALLAFIEKNIEVQAVAVQHFYWCFRALEGGDNHRNAFEKLYDLLLSEPLALPPEERREIWLLAINYAIKELNKGDKIMVRRAFELYRQGIENQSIMENSILSRFTYKNITRLGLGLQENEWVFDFLHSYKSTLAPRVRENYWRYNLAYFHFKNKNYDEAMGLLQDTNLADVFDNLDARQMLLVIYYETEATQALESLLESFRTYVRRQKNIGYQKENYLNLIRFTKRLMDTPPYDAKAKIKLRNDVEQATALASKEWLLEQI